MPVTRDANFPSVAAQLMQAFNRCADGHTIQTVIEASAQMFAASIHNYGRMVGWTREQTMAFAEEAGAHVQKIVADNIERQPKATDLKVDAQ